METSQKDRRENIAKSLADFGAVKQGILPRGKVDSVAEAFCTTEDETRLIEILESSDNPAALRYQVARALSLWGGDASAQAFIRELQRLDAHVHPQEENVVGACLGGLQRIGGHDAATYLRKLSEHPDQWVNRVAKHCLQQLECGGTLTPEGDTVKSRHEELQAYLHSQIEDLMNE